MIFNVLGKMCASYGMLAFSNRMYKWIKNANNFLCHILWYFSTEPFPPISFIINDKWLEGWVLKWVNFRSFQKLIPSDKWLKLTSLWGRGKLFPLNLLADIAFLISFCSGGRAVTVSGVNFLPVQQPRMVVYFNDSLVNETVNTFSHVPSLSWW